MHIKCHYIVSSCLSPHSSVRFYTLNSDKRSPRARGWGRGTGETAGRRGWGGLNTVGSRMRDCANKYFQFKTSGGPAGVTQIQDRRRVDASFGKSGNIVLSNLHNSVLAFLSFRQLRLNGIIDSIR